MVHAVFGVAGNPCRSRSVVPKSPKNVCLATVPPPEFLLAPAAQEPLHRQSHADARARRCEANFRVRKAVARHRRLAPRASLLAICGMMAAGTPGNGPHRTLRFRGSNGRDDLCARSRACQPRAELTFDRASRASGAAISVADSVIFRDISRKFAHNSGDRNPRREQAAGNDARPAHRHRHIRL